MNIAVMLLIAASVLAWPSGTPVSRVVPARAANAEKDAGAGNNAGAESIRTVVPFVQVSAARVSAAKVPAAEVAGVIDLLALTLQSGVGLVEAMEAVATRLGGPLGLHLLTVAAAGRWGVDEATAWANIPSAWQPAARALRMAANAGVPPSEALVRAAQEVRRAEQQRLEVATATLGIRIVLPLGLVFLPAFILTTVVPIVLALAQQLLANQ